MSDGVSSTSPNLRYQILDALRNHQRLRHAPRAGNGNFSPSQVIDARSEVDVDFVTGNDRLLFGGDFFRRTAR